MAETRNDSAEVARANLLPPKSTTANHGKLNNSHWTIPGRPHNIRGLDISRDRSVEWGF